MNYSDKAYKEAWRRYLYTQIDMGFKPRYLISVHYENPEDWVKQQRETHTSLDLDFKDRYSIVTHRDSSGNRLSFNKYLEKISYDYWKFRRSSVDLVGKDASRLRNFLLKNLFLVKRLHRKDLYTIPNYYIFHEMGKARDQFHTHILMPEAIQFNSLDQITELLFKAPIKCISKQRDPHVEIVDKYRRYEGKSGAYGVMNYLTKQTSHEFTPFDFCNSNPIISN